MTVFISVGRPIDTPMFEGDSYMSLPGIEGAVVQLKFSIRFLALTSGNMLLLYNGQTIFPGRGDFISLAINGGRVEFRFNMGSGTGIIIIITGYATARSDMEAEGVIEVSTFRSFAL